jgi:hypothetical protein
MTRNVSIYILLIALVIVTSTLATEPRKMAEFDPVTFCSDAATGDAGYYCGVQFQNDGEITAETVEMVSTRDCSDKSSKACLQEFEFAKVEGVTDIEETKKLALTASKNSAKEFCERVH